MSKMNPKVLEIAKKAGFAPLPGFEFANELQDIFLKKFADLLVKECACVIEADVDPAYTCCANTAYKLAFKVKEHFGVK